MDRLNQLHKPFETFEPLTSYIDSMVDVVTDPGNEKSLKQLQEAEETLVDGGVFRTPENQIGHYPGYEPLKLSSLLVDGIARISDGRDFNQYQRVMALYSQDALITLAAKMGVAGAFQPSDIEAATEIVVSGFERVDVADMDLTRSGKKEIGKELMKEYFAVKANIDDSLVIPKKIAVKNIDAGWQVVGRPYGIFTKAVAFSPFEW